MAQPHLYRTEAVVLRRLDYGEADRILTLFTRQRGKLRAIAKGVRRPSSRLGGHLELFAHSHLLLAHGRNLETVTQAETLHSFLGLREDLIRTSLACTAIELLDRLTPDGIENQAAFDLLVRSLDHLSTWRRPELASRYFAMQLLGILGYRPELRECTRCRTTLGPSANVFSAPSGGMLCLDCARAESSGRAVTTNCFKVLRVLQAGDPTLVSRLRLDQALDREIDLIIRTYVQYILEGDLRSTAFADEVRAGAKS